jgi:hypothetical protein
MRFVIPVLLLMLSATPNSVPDPPTIDPKTGNGLLEICTNLDERAQSLCTGYITGVADAFEVYPPGNNCKSVAASFFCLLEGVTNGQVKDVVIEYLKSHPATRHELSLGLIVNAFKAAWPCPKK